MKPNFKSFFKRFTIIDILIILFIIGIVAFAFMQTGEDEDKPESISFDLNTLNKLPEKYLSFHQEGKIVKTHVEGYNVSNMEYQKFSGTVIWVDQNSPVKVLINIDGDSNNTPIIAAPHIDGEYADIYIEYITLETNGEKYKNITEIQAHGENINELNELTNKIGNNNNFTISTKIALDENKNNKMSQELANKLQLNTKKTSITLIDDNQIILNLAGKEEIEIASAMLGTINGLSDIITIRIYDSTPEEVKSIKEAFDTVIYVRKLS